MFPSTGLVEMQESRRGWIVDLGLFIRSSSSRAARYLHILSKLEEGRREEERRNTHIKKKEISREHARACYILLGIFPSMKTLFIMISRNMQQPPFFSLKGTGSAGFHFHHFVE